MRRIAVSVPENVYRAAQALAAEQGTSVSKLVVAYLGSLSERDAELEHLNEQRRRIVAGIKHFSAADRLSRDEIHERGVR